MDIIEWAWLNSQFLDQIALQPLTTSGYVISAIAHTTSEQGAIDALYWLETTGSLSYLLNESNLPLYPQGEQGGAALVIMQGDTVTRLTYATTPGLDQLVQSGDVYGPTSIQILPAVNGFTAQLVIGGEHGLFIAELDTNGLPIEFVPMNIHGLPDGVQYGSAITGLTYSVDDDVLAASVLGGGTFVYSRSGDVGITPAPHAGLMVSEAISPQNAAESLDKRGNSVEGTFAIELPPQAFDDLGSAQVNFIVEDAALWREYLKAISFYLSANEGPAAFNMLARDGDEITETLTFNDFATMRMGTYLTQLSALQLPTVTLPYRVELLTTEGDVAETVHSSIDLVPNGSTPSFAVYSGLLPEGRKVFQARSGFGNGVDFQKLPFTIKAALPDHLPDGAEVFAFNVDFPNGVIVIDSTTYLPSDADYITTAVAARRIDGDTPLVAGTQFEDNGISLSALTELFINNASSGFLNTEGQYYGSVLSTQMPGIYGPGEIIPPFIGVGIQYPDGQIVVSTVDVTDLAGNTLNLNPSAPFEDVVLDVGNGGIFAAQETGGSVSVAKLGQMQSAVGFFRVDDLFGNIDNIAPGTAGYAVAALNRSVDEGLDINLTQAFGTQQSYDIDGMLPGCYYATFITRDTTSVEDALAILAQDALFDSAVAAQTSIDHVLFSFDTANPNGDNGNVSAAIPFAADILAFEDIPLAGDMDFNDISIYYGALV